MATAAAGFDAALYERWHDMQHRDSQVVVVDVERCGTGVALYQPPRGSPTIHGMLIAVKA